MMPNVTYALREYIDRSGQKPIALENQCSFLATHTLPITTQTNNAPILLKANNHHPSRNCVRFPPEKPVEN